MTMEHDDKTNACHAANFNSAARRGRYGDITVGAVVGGACVVEVNTAAVIAVPAVSAAGIAEPAVSMGSESKRSLAMLVLDLM